VRLWRKLQLQLSIKKETGTVSFFSLPGYLRKYEIRAPIPPISAKPKITKPIGIFPAAEFWLTSSNSGITNSGAGVKVGSRVGVDGTTNAAASVGSIVGVVCGVGVGGGSIIGRNPTSLKVTRGA
jgi:hypothetical protein